MEVRKNGVFLSFNDRIATTALFAYVRMLHFGKSEAEMQKTREYITVMKEANKQRGDGPFEFHSISLDGNAEENEALYRFLTKYPENVAAFILVQDKNNIKETN